MRMRVEPLSVRDRLTSERATRARAIVGDPVVRFAALAGLVWVVLYAGLLAATSGWPAGSRFVQVVVCLVPFLAWSTTNVVTCRRSRGRQRRMWRFFAVAAVCAITGMLLWTVATYVPALGAGIDLANLLLITAMVVCVPGFMLGFGGAALIRHARSLIDAGLLAITLGALGWYLLVTPRLSRQPDFNGWVDIVFVLLDIVVLVTLISGGIAGHRTVPFAVLLWTAGMVTAGVTDAVMSYLSVDGSVGDGGWANVGWQAQGVLLFLGSLIAARHTEPEAEPQLMDRDFSLPLLVLPAAGVTVVILRELGQDSVGVLGVVIVMVAGPLLRQLLIIRDRTRLTEALAAALREQERLATTDGLTGVYNRRYFNEALRVEGERAGHAGHPMAVIILDLDHFKRINDIHGHLVGDAVLVEIAARLCSAVRAGDIVARFGGEEFVVLLGDGDEARAYALAERLRAAVRSEPVAVSHGPPVHVSGSFGVASALIAADRFDSDLDALVRRADQALYQAKEAGRDCTKVALVAERTRGADGVVPPCRNPVESRSNV